MESLSLSRPNKWRKKSPSSSPTHRSLLLAILIVFIFFVSYKHIPNSTLPVSRNSQPAQCRQTLAPHKKYLWYAPHSGFSNQLSELKNALLMAALLNRTLIVPPVLDHHAVALGSCPKFRVLDANILRFSVWNHIIQLIQNARYISMADIIDFSSVTFNSAVQLIDFRDFVSMWCDLNIDFACSKDSKTDSSLFQSLRKCGSLLSGFDGNINQCIYPVDNDCRTTVWTYPKDDEEDGVLDLFQPDEQVKKKKNISFVRKRRNVYKALGPDSEAESATILAFGSLFTSPYKGSESYIDIHEAPRDERIQSIIEKIEFLPFISEITRAGKDFSRQFIKAPFFCAQLRLLDGQFKNHWKSTFHALKEKLESLKQMGPLPVHIFVMTDLPVGNWTGSYLGDLENDSEAFKLFILKEDDELVKKAAKELVAARRGRIGPIDNCLQGMRPSDPKILPDLRLYIEETICGCASLGFVGTSGSTIAESIELIRKHRICSG